jgi:uncharacterized protein
MKFTLDARSDVNLIRGYAAGEVRIGDETLRSNCVVSAQTLVRNWGPASCALLASSDLEPILELEPEVVLLGTGARQTFPNAAIRDAFSSRRIGLEVMDLGAACRTYNILVQEGRRVVAALFVD